MNGTNTTYSSVAFSVPNGVTIPSMSAVEMSTTGTDNGNIYVKPKWSINPPYSYDHVLSYDVMPMATLGNMKIVTIDRERFLAVFARYGTNAGVYARVGRFNVNRSQLIWYPESKITSAAGFVGTSTSWCVLAVEKMNDNRVVIGYKNANNTGYVVNAYIPKGFNSVIPDTPVQINANVIHSLAFTALDSSRFFILQSYADNVVGIVATISDIGAFSFGTPSTIINRTGMNAHSTCAKNVDGSRVVVSYGFSASPTAYMCNMVTVSGSSVTGIGAENMIYSGYQDNKGSLDIALTDSSKALILVATNSAVYARYCNFTSGTGYNLGMNSTSIHSASSYMEDSVSIVPTIDYNGTDGVNSYGALTFCAPSGIDTPYIGRLSVPSGTGDTVSDTVLKPDFVQNITYNGGLTPQSKFPRITMLDRRCALYAWYDTANSTIYFSACTTSYSAVIGIYKGGRVQTEGIVSGFSNLQVGQRYYKTDTGSIVCDGSYSDAPVGVAISPTELLLYTLEQRGVYRLV